MVQRHRLVPWTPFRWRDWELLTSSSVFSVTTSRVRLIWGSIFPFLLDDRQQIANTEAEGGERMRRHRRRCEMKEVNVPSFSLATANAGNS
jgi:hypothetical protein